MGRSPKFKCSLAGRWAVASMLACACGASLAQDSGINTALDRQVDEAFREVLRVPADTAASTRYARLLVAAGNYEGGIAALEHLLLKPDAPASIRLELAVLYYRLGSYAMSESLLRRALEDARLVGEQRTQAESLLRDVSARNQPSQLSGLVMLGLRVQSNPSARSNEDFVYAGGQRVALAERYKPESDTDLQLSARLDHRYDLGLQNEASVVSSLVAQITDYSSSSGSTLRADQTDPYNLALLELNSGVRFKPTATLPGLRLRPYLIATELLAQGHRYLDNLGAGLDVEYRADERTLAEAIYEYRHYDYATRVDVPDADLLGGPDNGLRLRLTRELAPGHVFSGELAARSHGTQRARYDYDTRELRLSYFLTHANPFNAGGRHWTSSLWAGAARRAYGAADPAVDPERSRKDHELRFGAGLTLPVADAWSVVLRLEHVNTNSSLPNYENRNTSFQAALAYRF